MSQSGCPEEAKLLALFDDNDVAELSTHIRDHLEACESCQTVARVLLEQSEFDTTEFRTRHPTDSRLDSALLFESLQRAIDGGQTESRSRSDDHQQILSLLHPAERPDEVGRLGGYRILELLGVGGMGAVFRAEDISLDRQIALKVMKPHIASSESARQRFFREAKSVAAIEHDHIVTIHQVSEDNSVPFIAMQFLRGESLADRIDKGQCLSVAESLRIAREVATGLAAAHEQGLLHRDIKPDNIWLEAPHDRVKILDFGLARTIEDNSNLTHSNMIIGTPGFMSPEQADGLPLDNRCDLFSLGSLLYRMLTGKTPFNGPTMTSILVSLTRDEPVPVETSRPDVPREVSSLVSRLLQKAPQRRPQSAGEIIDEISAIESQLDLKPASKQQPNIAPTKGTDKRHASKPFPITAVPGILLTLAALIAIYLLAIRFSDSAATEEQAVSQGLPTATIPATETYTNTIGMRLQRIPAGEFMMGTSETDMALLRKEAERNGANEDEIDTLNGETPQHPVRITNAFYIGAHEVTQHQYESVTGKNPSNFSRTGDDDYRVEDVDTSRFPVENISWFHAVEFCNQLSEREGLTPVYKIDGNRTARIDGSGYRLPTEAEWEYVCRAGSKTLFSFGNDVSQVKEHAWGHENSNTITHEVGTRAPNAFGVHDMLGNVWEWCDDWYDESYYTKNQRTDPRGPSAKDRSEKVRRGGDWDQPPLDYRSSARSGEKPNQRDYDVGFRIVLPAGSTEGIAADVEVQQ